MNAEGAETYLRTLAEARRRQAMTVPGAPRRDITEGVTRAADALAEVGAIDPSLAWAIVADLQQALDSRAGATGTPEQQAGRYELAPTPLEGAQWLDITTDSSQPGVRIDLTVPPAPGRHLPRSPRPCRNLTACVTR
jgi:hypothetical protein